jgi:hypothetical protein
MLKLEHWTCRLGRQGLDIKEQEIWLVRTVCYHEDQFTKNKRMFRTLMLGLFLTCTKDSLLFWTHMFTLVHVCYWLKEETHLLRKAGLFSWRRISHPHRSLSQSQLPCTPLHFPNPLACYLHTAHLFFTYKDDINKLNSSVGYKHLKHKSCTPWLWLLP